MTAFVNTYADKREKGASELMNRDELIFGCGPIGSFAADGDEATGRAALDAALAAGIRRFDVAPSYGDGQAESLLGDALADWLRETPDGHSTGAPREPTASPSRGARGERPDWPAREIGEGLSTGVPSGRPNRPAQEIGAALHAGAHDERSDRPAEIGEALSPGAHGERPDRPALEIGDALRTGAHGEQPDQPVRGAGGSLPAGAPDDRTRRSLTVATKVGRLSMANANPYARPLGREVPGGGGSYDFSASGVRRALEASLGRLRLEYVDIGFVHDPDVAPEQARDEAIPALAAARAEGLVGAVGVATTNPAVALPFVESGAVDHVMIAAAWTLTRRDAADLLDRCAEHGVKVHAAAPFDSGLLATSRPSPTAPSGYRVATPAHLEIATALADLCERHGVTLPAAAIQFPLRHRAVEAVVVGMRSPEEVRADLGLVDVEVPERLWGELG
jgi:D-threo-aldose 1-dehydrogenase